MKTGIILCAGLQNRFESQVPKALMTFKDKTIIEYNIETMSQFVDKIIVVPNFENNFLFTFLKNNYDIEIVPISGGGGCGFAVLQILQKYTDDILLIWGDSIQTQKILYEKTIEQYNNEFTLPLIYERSPYVKFELSENDIIQKVQFSKYETMSDSGFHDFSLFLFNATIIKSYLEKTTKRNDELIFLDLFNMNFPINGKGIIINENEVKFKNNSFNTLKEYNKFLYYK